MVWRAALLGEMQLFDPARPAPVPIRFRTAKTRLLLAYLLLHPGQSAGRETLAALLWPNSEREARRRSLRDALSFLRTALADAGLPEGVLTPDRSRVRLAPGVFQTDVAAFEAALAHADQIASLEEAIALYRGPLLEGDRDVSGAEPWIEPARRRYQDQAVDALGRLSVLHVGRGALHPALDCARRAAALDPTRTERVETLARQLRRQEQILPPDSDPGDLSEINHFVAPAAQAMEEQDYERAHGYYRRLLADAATDADRLEVARKLLELGKSAHFRDKGRGSLTLAALLDALPLFEEAADLLGATTTRLALAVALVLRGQRTRAMGYLEETAQHISALTDAEVRADCSRKVAEILLELGQYASARCFLEYAETLHTQTGSVYGVAFCRWHAGRLASDTGEHDAAYWLLEDARSRMAALSDETQTHAAVLGDLGDLHLRRGEPERAVSLYEEGLRVWEATGQTYWIAVFTARQARAALHLGQFEEAARLAQESLPRFAESNGPDHRSLALFVLGRVAQEQGRPDEGIALLEECVALRRRQGNPGPLAEALDALAALEGDLGQAHRDEAEALRREMGLA